jgi:hypothetical protein
MGLISATLGTAGTALSGISKTAFNRNTLISTASRGIIGSAIGAGVGYATSDANSPTNLMLDTLRGATLGALAGAGTMAVQKGITRGIPAMFSAQGARTMAAGAGGLLRGAKRTATGAGQVGGFMLKYPLATAGVVGGAVLVSNSLNSSPTMSGAKVNTKYDQQQMALTEMHSGTGAPGAGRIGTAPEMMGRFQRAHQQSTAGLVQGLHRGRHGG